MKKLFIVISFCISIQLLFIVEGIAQRFVDNGDGTVTDLVANIMWIKNGTESTYNHDEAMNYVGNLTFAEYDDWGLAGYNEFGSLAAAYSSSEVTIGEEGIGYWSNIQSLNWFGGQIVYYRAFNNQGNYGLCGSDGCPERYLFSVLPFRRSAPNEWNRTLSPKAQKVLDYLNNLSNNGDKNRVLSGQFAGYASGAEYEYQTIDTECTGISRDNTFEASYQRLIEELHNKTNKYVKIVGTDYGFSTQEERLTANEYIINNHCKKGGFVTISWHVDNPWTAETKDPKAPAGGPLSELLIYNTIPEADSPAEKWKASLDEIAVSLKKYKDNNIVVLWRPFHEMNGNWFWWEKKTRMKQTMNIAPILKPYGLIWSSILYLKKNWIIFYGFTRQMTSKKPMTTVHFILVIIMLIS